MIPGGTICLRLCSRTYSVRKALTRIIKCESGSPASFLRVTYFRYRTCRHEAPEVSKNGERQIQEAYQMDR